MEEVVADKSLIAYCGLYCGTCRSYLKGKCQGCHDNEKANWCKVRNCCSQNGYNSCADCDLVQLEDCKKFNTFISKVFGLLLNSDRAACIRKIKELGYDLYSEVMAEEKIHTLKRK